MKLNEIKPNPGNPRTIKDERFEKLCRSIEEFPKMMELRPIVVDGQGMILGGNMRYRALKELGRKEIPDEWVKRADELTEDEKRRFIIEDNVPFGDWDFEMLANEWDAGELKVWGLEFPTNISDEDENKMKYEGTEDFADELLLEHNYIVLYFDNHMDWQVACDKFGLKKVKSCDPAQKCQKVGIGRVLSGKDFIK